MDYSCQHFNSSSGFVYLPENTTEGTSTMCESHMYYTDGKISDLHDAVHLL